MRRSGSAENKRDRMAYNTFRWTPIVSTKRIPPNYRRLSTPCFASTARRLDVTSICRMFIALPLILTMSSIHSRRTRISGKANSLLAVGQSKSFLLLVRSSSFLAKVYDLETKALYSNKSTTSRVFLPQLFKEPICSSSV